MRPWRPPRRPPSGRHVADAVNGGHCGVRPRRATGRSLRLHRRSGRHRPGLWSPSGQSRAARSRSFRSGSRRKRSTASPRRKWVFTVPWLICNAMATSTSLRPRRWRSTTTSRCRRGKAVSAQPSISRVATVSARSTPSAAVTGRATRRQVPDRLVDRDPKHPQVAPLLASKVGPPQVRLGQRLHGGILRRSPLASDSLRRRHGPRQQPTEEDLKSLHRPRRDVGPHLGALITPITLARPGLDDIELSNRSPIIVRLTVYLELSPDP